jgi:hypothetical protein
MLYLLVIERRKKKRGETVTGFFSPGQTCPVGCAVLGFSQLLGAIKSCFMGQSLYFMCT